jgi:hypothetical protein
MSVQAPAAPRFQLGSLLQFGLSALALGGGLLGAAGLLFLGLNAGQAGPALQLDQDMIFAWIWVVAFLTLPAIPSLISSARRLWGAAAPDEKAGSSFALASRGLLLFPLALALGRVANDTPFLARFIFPIAAILATCLPIWWAVELARRGTNAGSPQRLWGTLNFALYFSTPLIFVIETVGLILTVIAVAVWANGDGQIMRFIQQMQQQIAQSNGDLEALRELYRPMLQQPWVLFGVYAVIAVLVPIVEELFKPLVLWFLLGRGLSPAAGLALGAVAGAGFALPETLFNLAGSAANSQWLELATGRVGTGFLHICTAALTGMAIAAVWRSGKIYLLALVYTLSVGLHGLWNALTITSGLAGFLMNEQDARLATVAATIGLVILAAAYVDILYVLNRSLRAVPIIKKSQG